MTTIQLLGFEEVLLTMLPTLPNVLLLDSPESIDIDNPVVVHISAAKCFADVLARKGADTDLPFVFLFVPMSHPVPAQMPGYVEETLTGPLADRLREVPILFRMLRAVEAVPESFFQQLDRPIPSMELHELPVDSEVQQFLKEHDFAHKAFFKAMERRRATHRVLVSPSVDDLAAYVDGLLDEARVQHIEEYLAESPASRAEVNLLRRFKKATGSASPRRVVASTQATSSAKRSTHTGDGVS